MDDSEILQRLITIEELVRPKLRTPLFLDSHWLDLFLEWSLLVQRTSPKWLGDQRRYLTWWSGKLEGVSLRTATLQAHIIPALDTARGGRAPRIATLKRFYSWLREERHELATSEDPTYGQLKVPQCGPAQLHEDKVISREDYRAVRKYLTPHYRAALDVLAGTGWHWTELDRFARAGLLRRPDILICPQTKGGAPLRTRVQLRTLEAARLLRERGRISEKRFRLALRAACVAATVREIKPGYFRHSVASYAIANGAAPASVAAFLGHRSSTTTRRFYATNVAPPGVPTLA